MLMQFPATFPPVALSLKLKKADLDLTSTPRLAPGCRLHPTEAVLLAPEGALNLQGPAQDILMLVDGQRRVDVIVDKLLQQYSTAEREEVQQDVLVLLERMAQRGVVRT